ncbi:MAG: response regulator transcription factor [Lachnospiraceae bacterium]|nr:response regulator transcription factor [Lachnospiraceae bacterium]
MTQKLLVVENAPLMQEAITDYFTSKSWQVQAAANGEEALELLARNSFHLALLDVMMPKMNGFTLCGKIRETSDIPIIFITARVLEEDELNGYALGADDYVTKPFSLPVLYAKAMALLKRASSTGIDQRLRAGSLEIDLNAHQIWNQGAPVHLPPKEYEMLLFFLENPGRIFSREQLLIRFWSYEFDGSERVVDNRIKKLRKAIGACGCVIQTVRKCGYRMEVKP